MVGDASDRLIILSAGPLKLVLSPATGGSIARFEFSDGGRTVPILRGCPSVPAHVLETGSFPLVPFVNRIRGGQFTFRGRTVRLAPNMAGDPSPLHGQGWLNPWTVELATSDEAVLEFTHPAGEWPWTYVATQHFKLGEGGLELELRCCNLSNEPMPCGLGQHPYFHCSGETRLRTKAEHVWTIDDKVLPVERIAATGLYDLSDRLVCGLGLDHGFGGWGGKAHISDPDWPFDLSLASIGRQFFQLYSPSAGEIFVAEPVSHANAAFNEPEESWAALGVQILEPGEEMSLTMDLALTPRRAATPERGAGKRFN